MLIKCLNMPNKVFLAIINQLNLFKKDERGLSGVVVTILLILVAVLAVVLIWGFLSGWLRDLWEQITGNAGALV
ncbi:MAG: hypothetical protein LBC73_06460 [Oscillospiraceae bacterium]|jgi:flagellin-like protein|nr:hypothetical protein [Oscillospiraceae bacterium]